MTHIGDLPGGDIIILNPLKKNRRRIQFMFWSGPAFIFSAIMVSISVGSFVLKGFHFGVDFTGGTLIELEFDQPTRLDKIRSSLFDEGFEDATVKSLGSTEDIIVKVGPRKKNLNEEMIANYITKAVISATNRPVKVRRIESIGPSVGADLAESGAIAVIFSLFLIFLYISARFQWCLSVGAVTALVHDVTITLGAFSLLGIEIDLTTVAALLTVLGYSLNDTVVVFDRVRENLQKIQRSRGLTEVVNQSLTETISRTMITSVTTLLVVLSLLINGGTVVHSFALVMLIGIVVGTYSSIYIASALALRIKTFFP